MWGTFVRLLEEGPEYCRVRALGREGTVTFETLQEFIVIGDDNPSTGQLLISDSSSSVLATVLDNISVQLEIDLDLDGTIDQMMIVPWSELDID